VSGERHPTQQELLAGAIRTVEEVLLPELQSAWARTSAVGLLGQLRYALARTTTDSLAAQDAALEKCLTGLFEEFPELRDHAAAVDTSGDASWDLREQAARLLVFAVGHESAAAEAVRAQLRPLLAEQLAQDLAETHPMLQAFLASGSLGSTG
jgi:hypothetical protein